VHSNPKKIKNVNDKSKKTKKQIEQNDERGKRTLIGNAMEGNTFLPWKAPR
jgi:hypothetical protein